MDMKSNLVRACITLFLLVSCSQAQVSEADFHEMLEGMYKQTVPLIKANELAGDEVKNYFILDTREAEEYEVSHLPGAQLVGFEEFDAKSVADIPKDKPIIVYCSVGYRSERIGEQLQEMGYTNVKNLYGGIFV